MEILAILALYKHFFQKMDFFLDYKFLKVKNYAGLCSNEHMYY